MHRFFISPESLANDGLILRDASARQIREVLKLRAGEEIAVCDNSGAEYRVELVGITRDAVRGRVVARTLPLREPRTQLVLYQGLLKADKFEWVLQKGTELGIAEFAPVVTARAVATTVSRAKQARWERIVVEAAEQSGRTKIPLLHPLRNFAEAVRDAAARGGCALIPWEEERALDLRAALNGDAAAARVHLFIGPEGGLTRDEIAQARAQGILPLTLGPRILRAETAGLVAASAVFFARGELDAG